MSPEFSWVRSRTTCNMNVSKAYLSTSRRRKLTLLREEIFPRARDTFSNPTIVDRPPENSRLVVEEPFGEPKTSHAFQSFRNCCTGPVVPLLSYSTYDEAIARANDTHYGLGASIWSGNTQRANELAQKIQAGTVWVNTHFELDGRVPFGGHKESGIGTEWGVGGLVSYCNSQTFFLKK